MPFIIGYQDKVPDAVVEGGAWLALMPVTNVQSDDLQEAARSASLDPTDTQLTIDTGSIHNVGMIVLRLGNPSPALEYRVRSYSSAEMGEGTAGGPIGLLLTLTHTSGGSALYDSTRTLIDLGTVVDWSDPNDWLEWEDPNFWDGVSPSEYGDLPVYIILTIPAVNAALGTAQYWKVELFDETNGDGYLDVNSVMLFRSFRPADNYAPDSNSSEMQFLQDMAESKGGRRTFSELAVRRAVRFAWPVISDTEAFDDWMRIGLLSRTSRRIFIVPEEEETGDRLRLRAFPATFTKTPAIAQFNVELGSTSVDAEEVL